MAAQDWKVEVHAFDESDAQKGADEAPGPDEEDVRFLLELRIFRRALAKEMSYGIREVVDWISWNEGVEIGVDVVFR